MALYETLQYTVIHDEGQIQIREYDNILLASTKTPINMYQDSGFNNVFKYISGNNKSNTKISMTTPVVTYESEEEIITGFTYPLNTIKKPYLNQHHLMCLSMKSQNRYLR